jgi:hypothetical protein
VAWYTINQLELDTESIDLLAELVLSLGKIHRYENLTGELSVNSRTLIDLQEIIRKETCVSFSLLTVTYIAISHF